jgi:CheY-like chemotaxis protein
MSFSSSELPPIVLFLCEDAATVPPYFAHLQHAGMWVAPSTRPVEALATVHELKPDVIVADMDFADGSAGLAFIDGLAISESTRKVPVIALTMDGSEGVPFSARDRVTLWVPKPVFPEVLVATVQQLLGEGHAVKRVSPRVVI